MPQGNNRNGKYSLRNWQDKSVERKPPSTQGLCEKAYVEAYFKNGVSSCKLNSVPQESQLRKFSAI